MSQIQSLNKSQHKGLRVDTAAARKQGANLRMMPVVLSEFQKLAIQYPVLFTKNGDTGEFLTVALFGFEDGENLFCQDGDWDTVYTPLNLRRLPFCIGKNDNKQHPEDHDYLVCLDVENPAISPDIGEALFDDAGNPTPYLGAMQTVLGNLIEGEVLTKQFIATLLEMQLLTPISLDITLVNQEKIRAEGMYSVDEDTLAALNSEQINDLHKRGYLAPIYTMIASVGQIYALVQKKNALASEPSAWFQKPA